MITPLRVYGCLLAGIFALVVGIVGNPWIVMPDHMYDPVGEGILIALGLVGIGWSVWVCVWRWAEAHKPANGMGPDASATTFVASRHAREAIALAIIATLWLRLYGDRLRDPKLSVDDFQYLEIAASWQSTADNLFTPFNEHLCVFTRLLTWAVCAIAPRPERDRVLAGAGMALFAAVALTLFMFVRREWRSPVLGIVALSLFALTRTHGEVITWYSASQWCWALLLALLSLLVLQRASPRTGHWRLAASTALAVAGPFNYAVGTLVGPLATLYLAARRRWQGSNDSYARCFVPLAGTVAALLVIIPLKGHEIVARASYGGRAPAESIAPLKGTLFGVRSTVDQLLLANLAMRPEQRLRRVCYAVGFSLVTIGFGHLMWRTAWPGRVMLGGLCILLSYAITMPFRAWVQYEDFLEWTRYQLFAQVGVVLVACTALGTYGPVWLRATSLSGAHLILVLVLAGTQFLLHGGR